MRQHVGICTFMCLMQDNPEYSFLFDGEGSDYYHWVLYCKLYNLQLDQPLPGAVDITASGRDALACQPAAQEPDALPAEVDSGFRQVLAALTGSKVRAVTRLALQLAILQIAVRFLGGTDKCHDNSLRHGRHCSHLVQTAGSMPEQRTWLINRAPPF